MNGRRAIIGLCAACALLVSAFAAQGASAATNGTTVFTCSESAKVKDFATEHCVPGETGTKFGHVEVTEKTHWTASNAKTNSTTTGATASTLKSTVAGSAIELVATGVHATGTLENMKDATTGEHTVSGSVTKIVYTGVTEGLLGCTVTGKPGGAGTIETTALTETTAGQGMGVKFAPAVGTVFAEFELTNCAVGPTTVKVVGNIKCNTSGATIFCEHKPVTESGTLHLGSAFGPVAGYEGKVTVIASGEKEPEGTTKPLSVTTVETP